MRAIAGQLGIGVVLLIALALCWRLQDASAVSPPSGTHLATAGGLVLAWLGFAVWMGRRGARHVTRDPGGVLIVHASQTGFATELAAKTADELRAGGLAVDVRNIDALTPARLAEATRALFIASTTGEGDAPDAATRFRGEAMRSPLPLAGLSYGVLALGDRDYDDFCAFGRELDGWLRTNGAMPLFDRVEVDNGDEGSLRHWQHHVAHLAGTTGLADWSRPAYQRWRLVERTLLNPGSEGAPCYHVALAPPDAAHLDWQAGDIAEIGPRRHRGDSTVWPHREYSIASLPADGALHLVVRQMRGKDGALGLGSGWLTGHAVPGDAIDLRVRTNAGFHPPADDRPVVLIGNGTGIAGLRALLKARLASGHHRNWLVFGERHAAVDRLHVDELERWRAQGRIERLDLVWSRDGGSERYVQDRLRASADALRRYVDEGASVYVCGSLDGMAPGVDAALRTVLGDDRVNALAASGRYRRDVY
ncbi:sulfite reductase (NADPH) flavoprotein alpha-component [Luteibacter sp. UNCMF331Sha3.1]|uniref:sulfite reductase subunit alpha n=1 Tax=Luteibacter sp. UNCMF331Sha3.1 TaxID=1502760 RepID=UPI0008B8B179|nr:sulfite reductase subunit alpha [Luteibacter sp. UNCMF331Sha3.1]SEM30017.1 sulfite reductase (NADPH) flavoprotein alpha-component [Luteibacter sp. UNCMF331Sha3.1]